MAKFLIISSIQKTLQPPLKKSKGCAADSPLETINKPSSHDRRHRLFAAGKAKGFEEGTECGRAQGLTEGIKEAMQSAAREVESLSNRQRQEKHVICFVEMARFEPRTLKIPSPALCQLR